jgi:hypothetical protein
VKLQGTGHGASFTQSRTERVAPFAYGQATPPHCAGVETMYFSGSVPLPPSQAPLQFPKMLQLPTQSIAQGLVLLQGVSRRASFWAAEQLAPPYAACTQAAGKGTWLHVAAALLGFKSLKTSLVEIICPIEHGAGTPSGANWHCNERLTGPSCEYS